MNPGKDYIGVGVGVFIFNEKNEFLMMLRGENAKSEKHTWMIPGGTIDFNERAAETTVRETKEELGIDIEVTKQLFAIDHILPDENQHWMAIIHEAKVISGEPKIMEPHKHEEIKWFSMDNLPENISIVSKLSVKKFKENV